MMNPPDRIAQYRIEQLQAEVDLVLGDSNRLALLIYKNPVFRFLTYHLQNFFWTLTRLVGLGRWHDGSRPEPPLASRPLLKNAAPQRHPRILIDATQTFTYGGHTGVQRVVREIAAAAAASGEGLPIIIKGGRFVPYFQHPTFDAEIVAGAGDHLLLIDSVWYKPETYLPVISEVAQKGCRIVLGIHDLIPLHYPWVAQNLAAGEAFRAWLERAVPHADAIVTESRSMALEIRDHVAKLEHKPDLRLGWQHLGADFAVDSSPSREVVDFCAKGPYFLTVGMIEPRKGHPVALAAFEKLWKRGIEARYLMIGQYGWNAQAFRQQILNHPEYRRRLFWLDRASDADLGHAYRHATSLVYPSFAEGFGLPLVEAGRYGLPVIASDISVFREIGGEAITYFELLDADSLAARIADALAGKGVKPSFPICTWQEAANGFMRLIRNGAYQLSVATKSAASGRSAIGMI
ncbi:MAG: glycosyltransferase family 1 protein [Methylovirgula sp.]